MTEPVLGGRGHYVGEEETVAALSPVTLDLDEITEAESSV